PLLARGARVIASIWGRSIEDYAKAAAALAAAMSSGAARLAALEVNVSCPNVEDRGHMFAHRPEATAAAVRAAVDQVPGLPVFAKLSPNVTDLVEIAAAALQAGATGLTLINTRMGLAVDADRRRPRSGGQRRAGRAAGGVVGLPVRDRLALALDADDLGVAMSLADRLDPWFGIVKIGLELFAAAGPAAVEALAAPGRRIFLDLK